MGTQPPVSEKGSGALPPQYVAHFYCGQTAGCIKMTLGTEVGLTQRKLCYMGIQHFLSKKGADPPIFGQRLLWPNGCMDQEGTWHGVRPQPRRLCVRWGPPPPQKGGGAPKFSAHVYCGQTGGWIKMPLGTKVGLIPKDFVFDGHPAMQHAKITFKK